MSFGASRSQIGWFGKEGASARSHHEPEGHRHPRAGRRVLDHSSLEEPLSRPGGGGSVGLNTRMVRGKVRRYWGFAPLLALCLSLFCCGLNGAEGKKMSFVIDTEEQWMYLDKFTFDTSGEGMFTYAVEIAPDQELVGGGGFADGDFGFVCGNRVNLTAGTEFDIDDCKAVSNPSNFLLMYNDVATTTDSRSEWRNVYADRSVTCGEKKAYARQPIPLESGIINRAQIVVQKSLVPRTWYVVLNNCRAKRLTAKVTLEFFNQGWESKALQSPFSHDKQGILEMSIFFVTFYIIFAVIIASSVRRYLLKDVMNEVHWLLVGSFACYWIMHVLTLANGVNFYNHGSDVDWLVILARCLEICGFLLFLNSLLLLARGWTITTNKLSRKSEMAFLSGVIICIYIALFFSETMADPAQTVYLYDSWPGYLFIAMQIFVLALFLSLLTRTMTFEKRVVKRAFYKKFGFIFSLWFIQLPIFVAITKGIPYYYQEKVTTGLQWTVQLVAFLLIPTLSGGGAARDVYSVEGNYDARIPSLARQQRVQPTVLPAAHQAGSAPGRLPPVNPNMRTNLNDADHIGNDNGTPASSRRAFAHPLPTIGNGDAGIVETSH